MDAGTGMSYMARICKAAEIIGTERFEPGRFHVQVYHDLRCPRAWVPFPCTCVPRIVIQLPPSRYEVDAYGFPVRFIGDFPRLCRSSL